MSLADKLDNVRTMLRGHRLHHEELWERSGKNATDVRWYYDALVSRFAKLRPGPLTDELARTVAALDREIAADTGAPVN